MDKDMHDNEGNIDVLDLKGLMRHSFLKDCVRVQHSGLQEKYFRFGFGNELTQIIF